jgi:hypothetical protein
VLSLPPIGSWPRRGLAYATRVLGRSVRRFRWSSAATASQEPLETLASIVTAGVRSSLRSSLLVLSASALCVARQAALSSRAERCGWVSRTLELGPISAVMTRSMPSARACASAARVALAACRDQGNRRQNPARADTATALSSARDGQRSNPDRPNEQQQRPNPYETKAARQGSPATNPSSIS